MTNEVSDRLRRIEGRLDVLEKTIKTLARAQSGRSSTENPLKSIGLNDLLDLPSSLQKTMLAIQGLNEATASEVSEKTGRDRSIETIYLNQLMRLGHLTKERKGRKIYFKIMRYY